MLGKQKHLFSNPPLERACHADLDIADNPAELNHADGRRSPTFVGLGDIDCRFGKDLRAAVVPVGSNGRDRPADDKRGFAGEFDG